MFLDYLYTVLGLLLTLGWMSNIHLKDVGVETIRSVTPYVTSLRGYRRTKRIKIGIWNIRGDRPIAFLGAYHY